MSPSQPAAFGLDLIFDGLKRASTVAGASARRT
jgi:hypothetical protein